MPFGSVFPLISRADQALYGPLSLALAMSVQDGRLLLSRDLRIAERPHMGIENWQFNGWEGSSNAAAKGQEIHSGER